MATVICSASCLPFGPPGRRGWRWPLVGLLLTTLSTAAATPSTSVNRAREESYRIARAAYAQNTNHATAAWQLARATFDLAEAPLSSRRREELALEGIAACEQALEGAPKLAPAHYYLGMNLGQLARVRRFSALRLVRRMEEAFLTARTLDAVFDFGGPDRNLGLLYREAPGWPTSVGNKSKARKHLAAAVTLAPMYLDNPLNLGESGLRWRDPAVVQEQVALIRRLWPKARQEFSGPEWRWAWEDWEPRWTELQAQAAKLTKGSSTRHAAEEDFAHPQADSP